MLACLFVVFVGQRDTSYCMAGLIFKPQTVIGAWITAFCGRAMWVEMDGGGQEEGQEMRGSWSLGSSLHAPSLTHLSFRCRDGREGWGGGGAEGGGGVGEGGMLRTSCVSWWTHDSQRGVVCVGMHLVRDVHRHPGRCTHVETHKLHNIIASCAPDNPEDLM